jgi:Holliday junction resolvase RusA-like endonuclease
MNYRFNVPGECLGKMRPKASSFGGHAKVYTPSKQIEYENWVRMCFRQAYPEGSPIEDGIPVSVSLHIKIAVHSSLSKKRRAMALAGEITPTRKPDLDNAAKSVMDALNGVAFHDDKQVVNLTAAKSYAEEAGVSVEIETIELGETL